MKSAIFEKAGQMIIEEVKKPTLERDDDVIIKVVRACVCGSDLWSYAHGDDKAAHSENSGHEALGILRRQIKNIDNAPANGKLPRRLDLITFLISHRHKFAREHPLFYHAVFVNTDHIVLNHGQRQLVCHQRGKGRDDRDWLPLQNPALHADAFL